VDAGFISDKAPVTADMFKDTVRLIGIKQSFKNFPNSSHIISETVI
jgi:hypothetical protein